MRTVFVSLLILSSTAQADMTLNLQSEKGDYIGQGLTQSLNFTAAQISTTVNAFGEVDISASSGTHSFSIALGSLKNVAGAAISEGTCYDRAQRTPFRNDGRPGIDMSMDARGCNDLMGRYRVREFTQAAGHVQTLSLDFVQHCSKSGGPALFGNLRLNSAVAANTAFIDPVYSANGSLHFIATGIGIGSSAPGHTATIAFTRPLVIASRNFDQGISLAYTGPLPGLATNSLWNLDFAGPSKAVLAAAGYSNAVRYPFQPDGIPGLDFTYDHAGSNTVTGSFTIGSVVYDSLDGLPVDFNASFVHNREGNTANQSNGQIAYHAVFNNGGAADQIFDSGFESGEVATPQTSLAYPCTAP